MAESSAEPRAIWSPSVVMSGMVSPALLHLQDGRLQKVLRCSSKEASAYAKAVGLYLEIIAEVVSPGLIDTHVHLSPLNRTWEGFTTGTRAAAAGGVTTVVLMPLNSLPPTTTPEALEMELQAAATAHLYADVGFWGGVVPGNRKQLKPLLEAGVLGIKAFLSPLPAAAGFEAVLPEELSEAAPAIAAADVPLLVHSELMTMGEIDHLVAAAGGSTRSFATFLATRPRQFEQRAHQALVEILDKTPGLHVHIVHLSDATSLGYIAMQQERLGANRLTVETCPHYLLLAAEDIPEGDTRFKCFPPIREGWNRGLLFEGLLNGTISTVASDHSPCDFPMRQTESGDFFKAWAGLTALQYSLPATWAAVAQGGLFESNEAAWTHLARWWSEQPAELAGLHNKGRLKEGFDADLVIWDPFAVTTQEHSFHKHDGSAYAGRLLRGAVRETILRGKSVYKEGEHAADAGRVLLRSFQSVPMRLPRISVLVSPGFRDRHRLTLLDVNKHILELSKQAMKNSENCTKRTTFPFVFFEFRVGWGVRSQ